MTIPPLDPDLMLRVLSDPETVLEAKSRAKQMTSLFREAGVPGDAHSFVALLLMAATIDASATCPLGPERFGQLASVLRGWIDEALAQAKAKA